MTSTPPTQLSPSEEITLRRVAFGESPARTLSAVDLERLRRLRLVVDDKDGPRLTASGRTHFDSLPKPIMASTRGRANPDVVVPQLRKPRA